MFTIHFLDKENFQVNWNLGILAAYQNYKFPGILAAAVNLAFYFFSFCMFSSYKLLYIAYLLDEEQVQMPILWS